MGMKNQRKITFRASLIIIVSLALVTGVMLCERRAEASPKANTVAEHHFYADQTPAEEYTGWWSISYSLPADDPNAKHARVVIKTEADE
jgi:hypothetical protein